VYDTSPDDESSTTWTYDDHTLYGGSLYLFHYSYSSGNNELLRGSAYSSNAGYVQLYKKEVISLYNVTVNPSANGTVSANPTKAKAGDTIELTLTPNNGYRVETVTVTSSAGCFSFFGKRPQALKSSMPTIRQAIKMSFLFMVNPSLL
jgi:hypothetical protein